MKTWVIKLGGAALSDQASIENLAEALLILKKEGHQVAVVHGGGPRINQRLRTKNIEWSFFEGQRITTPEMMDEIEIALDEINQMISMTLKDKGLKAIGVSAKDERMFFCKKMHSELGQVGEILSVNPTTLQDIWAQGAVPVISPIGIDNKGVAYNINADWAASNVAQTVNSDVLIYATDQRGILDLNELPYDSLTLDQIKILMEKGGVTGGMLAKSRSIEMALLNGVGKVCVTHALELQELIETKRGGTLCVLMSRLDYVLKIKENQNVAS